MVQFSQATQSIKQTSGSNNTVSAASTNFKASDGAGTTTSGLVIGTGTNPTTVLDYVLQAQVSTNITHAAQTSLTESFGTDGWRTIISRNFVNNTGSTVQVREIGWYVNDSGYTHCLERSLYSVDVPNGKTLTLTYRFSVGA